MSGLSICAKYTTFAVIATIFNIGAQDILLRVYHGQRAVALSVLVGTAVGLLLKYILDKKYIFQFRIQNRSRDVWTFVLYTFTGVLTTAIFWGFEFSFDYFFHTKEMRYAGGVVGLAIGYLIKYQLDKQMVFVKRGS